MGKNQKSQGDINKSNGNGKKALEKVKSSDDHLILYDSDQNRIQFEVVNGDLCLSAEQIGVGLGYEDPASSINRIYSRNEEELRDQTFSVKLTENPQSGRPVRVFTEEGVYLITMLARTERAREFRKKVAALIKALRERQINSMIKEAIIKAMEYQAKISSQGWGRDFLPNLVRYRKMGLNHRETGLLLGCRLNTVWHHEKGLREYGLWEALWDADQTPWQNFSAKHENAAYSGKAKPLGISKNTRESKKAIMVKKSKVYRIRLDPEKDRDILERLENIQRPLRGAFIKTSLRFYMKNGGNDMPGPETVDSPQESNEKTLG